MKPPLPHLAVSIAITADAKLSACIASPAAEVRLQETRAGADAIIVGCGSVEPDTIANGLSRQDLRGGRAACGAIPEPLRVLVSDCGSLGPKGKDFQSCQSPPVVFSTVAMPGPTRAAIAPLCDLHLFSAPAVPLLAALQILYKEYHIRRAVCEGGCSLLHSLAEADLIDEILLAIDPVIVGGVATPTFSGLPGPFLPHARAFKIVAHRIEGSKWFLRLIKKR